jgi:hypothetical protein
MLDAIAHDNILMCVFLLVIGGLFNDRLAANGIQRVITLGDVVGAWAGKHM